MVLRQTRGCHLKGGWGDLGGWCRQKCEKGWLGLPKGWLETGASGVSLEKWRFASGHSGWCRQIFKRRVARFGRGTPAEARHPSFSEAFWQLRLSTIPPQLELPKGFGKR